MFASLLFRQGINMFVNESTVESNPLIPAVPVSRHKYKRYAGK